jgi:hypothetical protein
MEKAMVMRGTFLFGLIAAILVASAISIVVSTQLVIGPQGTLGPQARKVLTSQTMTADG